jgi:hypothetical protein
MNLELPLNLPSRRPLVTLEGAVTLLDLDPLAITHACEQGLLGWAFDLGNGGPCGSHRRELRIWRGSIAAWLRTSGKDGAALTPEKEVIADILPSRDLRSAELWRRLSISRQHLVTLLPHLHIAAPATPARGVNAAELIARDSARQLLLSRRLK